MVSPKKLTFDRVSVNVCCMTLRVFINIRYGRREKHLRSQVQYICIALHILLHSFKSSSMCIKEEGVSFNTRVFHKQIYIIIMSGYRVVVIAVRTFKYLKEALITMNATRYPETIII